MMDAMQDLCMDDLDKGSNMDQRVAYVERNVQHSLGGKCYPLVAVQDK